MDKKRKKTLISIVLDILAMLETKENQGLIRKAEGILYELLNSK